MANKNNHNKETIVRYMNKDLGESESFNNLKDVKEHLIKHLSSTLTSGEALKSQSQLSSFDLV